MLSFNPTSNLNKPATDNNPSLGPNNNSSSITDMPAMSFGGGALANVPTDRNSISNIDWCIQYFILKPKYTYL